MYEKHLIALPDLSTGCLTRWGTGTGDHKREAESQEAGCCEFNAEGLGLL